MIDPAKAKEVAGTKFARYIDEQVQGVMYAVSVQDRAKVASILQAAGVDPGIMRETIQAKYVVRDQYAPDVADGTLDALVSDHTPVGADEKNLPFADAVPGATGLELLLSLALKWGDDSGAGLLRALAVITCEPVRTLGEAIGSLAASAGRLVAGGVADVCVFDPAVRWAVRPAQLLSQGRHTPFAFDATAMELPGRVRFTLVAGQLAYAAETA